MFNRIKRKMLIMRWSQLYYAIKAMKKYGDYNINTENNHLREMIEIQATLGLSEEELEKMVRRKQ